MTRKEIICCIIIALFVGGVVTFIVCGCASQQDGVAAARAQYQLIKDTIYTEAERAYGPQSTWTPEVSNAVAATSADAMSRHLRSELDRINRQAAADLARIGTSNNDAPSYSYPSQQNVWVRKMGQPDQLVQVMPAY